MGSVPLDAVHEILRYHGEDIALEQTYHKILRGEGKNRIMGCAINQISLLSH